MSVMATTALGSVSVTVMSDGAAIGIGHRVGVRTGPLLGSRPCLCKARYRRWPDVSP